MQRASEPSQTKLLRDRFKARCEERAARAREESIRCRRYPGSEPNSSDAEMAEDDSDDDEAFMADEVRLLTH